MSEKTDKSELSVEDFDLDEFIAGGTTTVRKVKLYQKAGLIGEADELKAELELVSKIPAKNRSITDPSPAKLKQKIRDLYEEFEESGRWFKIKGITRARIDKIRKDVLKANKDAEDDDVMYACVADAVVTPNVKDGAQIKRLRAQLGESQYLQLTTAFNEACYGEVDIDVPFSVRSYDSDEAEDDS